MRIKAVHILLPLVVCLLCGGQASAQFKEKAFSQNYDDQNDTTKRDTSQVMFSFKEFFGGVKHQREARIGVLFAGSTIFPGCQQIYNDQKWKLPVIYGGIGASVGLGITYRHKWKNTGDRDYQHLSNWFFAGAGLVYWGMLLDGVANYNKGTYPQAGKATLYSILVPGMGQAYNHEYWKIPIYYGLMIGSFHYLKTNAKNYKRYKNIYKLASDPESGYDGNISAESAKYYRDVYRRYRDYSVLALAASYLLQVIDANVFSYMQDFELTDDLAMKVSPTIITDQPAYALNAYSSEFHNPGLHYSSGSANGVGLKVGFRF